jgi:hypothetical protein
MRNDGTDLSVMLRGVQFSGPDFDTLEAAPHTTKESLAKFMVSFGRLCSCVLDVDIETPVLVGDEEQTGILAVHLELGEPTQSGALDRETLRLSLRVNCNEYSSEGADGFFESELQSLQRRIPMGVKLKMCFSCAYSDYHPVGHGLFGDMACFRNAKAEYLCVRDKSDIFRVWNKGERVQETYLCTEFSPRKPNTGHRG